MKNLESKIILTLIFCLTASSQLFSQEMRMGIEIPLKNYKNFSIDLEIQTRFALEEKLTHTSDMATLAIEYDINKHFELGASYRLIANYTKLNLSEDQNIFSDEDNRITFDATYKTSSFDNYTIKNKVRYQISDFENNIDKSYIRNKTLLSYKVSKFFIPYTGLEFIYRLEKKQLKTFRIHAGTRFKVLKKDVTSYFIIENVVEEVYVDLNYIMGLKLSF